MSSPSSASKAAEFRRLSVLIGVNFVDMLGALIVIPLLPFYALRLHATPETVGWLTASFFITQVIAAPFWGRVSDRYGRRPALLIGLTASAVAFLLFGLANTLWLLFLSRLVQGLGGGTTGVAQAYVSDTVAREHRARGLGWLSAATNAGVSIGPAIGSLSTHMGQATPGYIASALCGINAIAAFFWLPESRTAAVRSAPVTRQPVWHAAWQTVRHPRGKAERLIWIYGVGMLAFMMMMGGVLPLWLNARFAITERSIGYFYVYYGILSFVMRSAFLGPVVDRIGETGALRLGTVLLATGMLLYPLVPSIWVLVAIIPFVPIGTALMFPAVTSLLSHRVDPAELGTMMGVGQTFAGIARIVAPIVGTMAFQQIGISAPFIFAGCIVLLVSWATFRHVHVVAATPETVQ